MKLPNNVYDVLKWVVLIVIPAIAFFYKDLAGIWGWGLAEEVPKTLYAVETLLGTALGFSTMVYNAEKKEELQKAKALNHQEGE